jgi:hypothetical protein
MKHKPDQTISQPEARVSRPWGSPIPNTVLAYSPNALPSSHEHLASAILVAKAPQHRLTYTRWKHASFAIWADALALLRSLTRLDPNTIKPVY